MKPRILLRNEKPHMHITTSATPPSVPPMIAPFGSVFVFGVAGGGSKRACNFVSAHSLPMGDVLG